MQEIDPVGTPADQPDAHQLAEQLHQLGDQDAVIGVEGGEAGDTGAVDDTDTDTSGIGCGEDVMPLEVPDADDGAGADTAETAPDTRFPREEAIDRFERFKNGETVPSSSVTVAPFPLSEQEQQTLDDIRARNHPTKTLSYDQLHSPDHADRRGTGLTKPAAAALAALGDRFLDDVRADAEANGYGPVRAEDLKVRAEKLGGPALGWHADKFTTPTARYVLSLGDDETHFAHGPINADDITEGGNAPDIDTDPDTGTHADVSHGSGAVTRFMAGHDVHRSPEGPGWRVFFNVSVPVNPEGGQQTEKNPELPIPDAAGAVAVGETVETTATTETAETGKNGEVDDTPPLPRAEALERYAAWDRGETVESRSMPVCEVAITDDEAAVLRTLAGRPFRGINTSNMRDAGNAEVQEITGMTEEQLRVLDQVDKRFVAAASADAERNGYDPIKHAQHGVFVGEVAPYNKIDWHTDRLGGPTVRYVLSFGDAGSTRFAHGSINKEQISQLGDIPSGDIDTGPGGSHQEVTYPTGTLVRFLAGHDIHAAPTADGFRLFLTISATLFEWKRYDRKPPTI